MATEITRHKNSIKKSSNRSIILCVPRVACAAGGIVYCVIKVLAAEPQSKKKEWGRGVFLAASPLVAAPPPTLTRLVQRLRRQISLA